MIEYGGNLARSSPEKEKSSRLKGGFTGLNPFVLDACHIDCIRLGIVALKSLVTLY